MLTLDSVALKPIKAIVIIRIILLDGRGLRVKMRDSVWGGCGCGFV